MGDATIAVLSWELEGEGSADLPLTLDTGTQQGLGLILRWPGWELDLVNPGVYGIPLETSPGEHAAFQVGAPATFQVGASGWPVPGGIRGPPESAVELARWSSPLAGPSDAHDA